MTPLWPRHIAPILDAAAPARIVEIGAGAGRSSEALVDWCRPRGARLDVVDPAPAAALRALDDAVATLTAATGVDAIPALPPADVAILGGDRNWRTVYTELSLLRAAARRHDRAMPIALVRGCAWPTARRDRYHDPALFREIERHPCARKGLRPGDPGLVDDGLFDDRCNAAHEGGPENGVLTAAEDFAAAAAGDVALAVVPVLGGLAILIPAARATPALAAAVAAMTSAEALREACVAAETEAACARAELVVERRRLARRTEALARARALLAARDPA